MERYKEKERFYLRYNIYRPIMLVLIAFTAKTLVETIGLFFGMEPLAAENLGFIAMIAAGSITYMTFLKQQRLR